MLIIWLLPLLLILYSAMRYVAAQDKVIESMRNGLDSQLKAINSLIESTVKSKYVVYEMLDTVKSISMDLHDLEERVKLIERNGYEHGIEV